tara:strand:+ start:455 stop:877 length:423 start_codon:yes stop_codon:yes gene_type:complete
VKIRLKKAFGVLVPSLPEDEEKMKGWTNEEIIEVNVRKPRNPKFHRKFFALVGLVFANQEKYTNREDLLVELKIRTGHYKEHINYEGLTIYIPKSISFEKMDELEFEKFYNKVIDVVLQNFMKVDRNEMDRLIEEVLRFS